MVSDKTLSAHRAQKKRVQLNNKKSCICAGNRLLCWLQRHHTFPKPCKEYYSLLSTFLWIIKEDNSCFIHCSEQLGALKENI